MPVAEPTFADNAVVADVMLRDPKTLPGDARVADVRAALANPKVQMVLLADGPTFRGAVTELPPDASASAPALEFAEPSPDTIGPTESAATAYALTAKNPKLRVVVLDENGRLVGLLCLNATRTHFCGAAG
ncbi:MAG TPA: CBS domain-containing protein [Gaiellaceae bacterium]|jgi:CBS domain-containing protein|nr:CBS domain-containing protein [Gaiellaceae bacterium]